MKPYCTSAGVWHVERRKHGVPVTVSGFKDFAETMRYIKREKEELAKELI